MSSARSSKSSGEKPEFPPKTQRANVCRKRGSRDRKAPAGAQHAAEHDSKVVSPERRNLSDAATPPREGHEEAAGPSHKNWRLGEAVVAVEPSGFSDVQDDDVEGADDLFSDVFREKNFRAPELQPSSHHRAPSSSRDLQAAAKSSSSEAILRARDASEHSDKLPVSSQSRNYSSSSRPPSEAGRGTNLLANEVPDMRGGLAEHCDDGGSPDQDPSETFFSKLAERLSQKQKLNQDPTNAGAEVLAALPAVWQADERLRAGREFAPACKGRPAPDASCCDHAPDASDHAAQQLSAPAASVARSDPQREALAGEDHSSVKPWGSGEGSVSFEYDLSPQSEEVGDANEDENDDEHLDHGSQFHCYGDIAIEETQSEVGEETEDRIASSCPEEEEQQGSSRDAPALDRAAFAESSTGTSKTPRASALRVEGAKSSQRTTVVRFSDQESGNLNSGTPAEGKHALKTTLKHSKQVSGEALGDLQDQKAAAPSVHPEGNGGGWWSSRVGAAGQGEEAEHLPTGSQCNAEMGDERAAPSAAGHGALSAFFVRGKDASRDTGLTAADMGVPEPRLDVAAGGAEKADSADAGAFAGFQTGSGKLLQTKSASYSKAQALLGGILVDLQSVSYANPVAESTANGKDVDLAASACSDLIADDMCGNESLSKSSPTPRREDNACSSHARSEKTFHPNGYDALMYESCVKDEVDASSDEPVRDCGENAKESIPHEVARDGAASAPVDFGPFPVPSQAGKMLLGDSGRDVQKDKDRDMEPGLHSFGPSLESSVAMGARPRRGLSVAFSYHLQEEAPDNLGHAGRNEGMVGCVSFKTGKGRSLAPSSDSLRNAASKFGDLFAGISGGTNNAHASTTTAENGTARAHDVRLEGLARSRSESALPKKSTCMPFEYSLPGGGAGAAAGSFGSGAPSRSHSMVPKSTTSIFGSLIDDLKALSGQRGSSLPADDAAPGQLRPKDPDAFSALPAEVRDPLQSAWGNCGEGEPVFTRGTGKLIQPSKESMQAAALRYGERLPHKEQATAPPGLPSHDSEPIFSTGTGKVVNPSSEGLRRAQALYGERNSSATWVGTSHRDINPESAASIGDAMLTPPSREDLPIAAAPRSSTGDAPAADGEPFFTRGSGARVEPSAASLARAMASYGGKTETGRGEEGSGRGRGGGRFGEDAHAGCHSSDSAGNHALVSGNLGGTTAAARANVHGGSRHIPDERNWALGIRV